MTDFEKWKELLDSCGVPYRVQESALRGRTSILLECCMTGSKITIGGYAGMFTEIEFEPDGTLFAIGAWE